MTDFLIKSTLAMGVLLCLYYILFEREKMHRFNRFYLLSALAFSLALPFVTVITYIQEIPSSNQTITINSEPTFQPVTEQPVDYLFYIGWAIYTAITLILVVRFTVNIVSFFRKADKNPSVMMGKAKLVLLEEKVLPHTFLNYIFLNREEYEAKLIEDELYTHEYTHVKQKHTLDILFIEALKTLFWFNPVLYCYKLAIQLNHEFLADEKVIDTTANTVYYQNLLLEKATVGTTFSMASNLTFSLTKKRFIMMTKTTSASKAGFIKLAILPVVTILMMLLCTKTIAQQTSKEEAERKARIESMLVSDEEMDSLKKANPDMFSDDLNVRFKDTKFTFVDKNGIETTVTGYKSLNDMQKKSVSYAPEMYGMDLTIYEPVKTTETVKIPESTELNSKDPNIVYKNTKFKFTDKNGNVSIKTGYMTLTEEDRKKVAPILPALGNKDLVEYTETEKGFNLHQGSQDEKSLSYDQVSPTAEYPGGIQAFFSYFNKNFNIPKMSDGMYRIYLSFTVEKDGSLSDIKYAKGDEVFKDEAIRVLKKSDKWIPAKKDGVAIRSHMNIPITINIKN